MKLSLLGLMLSPLLVLATRDDEPIRANDQENCAVNCPIASVCCVAGCYSRPCPTAEQADNAADCIWHCPVGVGTPHDVVQHARCREDCIRDHYQSSASSTSATGVTPAPSSSADGGGDGRPSTSTSTSSTTIHPGETSTATDGPDKSGAASANNQASVGGASVAGLLGYVLAWAI